MNALTRDPELNFFIAVGVLWVAWWGLHLWRWRLRVRAMAAEQSETGTVKRLQSLQRVTLLLLFGPLIISTFSWFNFFSSRKIFRISPENFGYIFTGLVITYLVTLIVMTLDEFRREQSRTGKKTDRREVLQALAYLLPFFVLTVTIWGAALPSLGGPKLASGDRMMWFYAGLATYFLLTRFIHRKNLAITKSGAGLDLDDCPLRSEILAMAAQVHIPVKSIRVIPPPRLAPNETETITQVAVRRSMWFNRFNPETPTIPVEITLGMSSETFTAGVASLFIRAEYQHVGFLDQWWLTKNWPRVLRKIVRSTVLTLSIVFLLILGVVVFFFDTLSLTVAFVGFLAWGAYSILSHRREKGRQQRSESITRVVEIWQKADPRTQRTPQDYLAEIVKFNLALNPNMQPKNLLAFTLGIESVQAYFKTLDEEAQEQLRARMEAALSEVAASSAPSGACDPA